MCLVFVALRLLAVDIAGIVTNDSLGYLRRADDPFGAGFVSQGYRQAAYPLLISISNLVGDVLGWDHIFGVALVQRGLLVVAVGTVIWALRWWSVPVVVVATSSSFVVHADLLLPEGTLVPACLLLGGLLAAAATARTSSPRLAKLAVIAAAATVALSASIKLQYAALILVAAAIAWLVHRDLLISRRFAVTAIGSTAFFVALLGTVQALENRSELGVFEPVSERARAEWYGAWQAVFGVHPDNRDDPQLAEFYDGGNLYTFLHGIERAEPDYPTRARIIRDRVDDMFDAADTTPRAEQVAALLGAMRAGRLDDIDGILDGVLDAPDGDSMARISFNSQFADRRRGHDRCRPQRRRRSRRRHDRAARRLHAAPASGPPRASRRVGGRRPRHDARRVRRSRSSSPRRRVGARICGADRLGVEHRVHRQCPLPARTVGADAGRWDAGGTGHHPTRRQAHRTAPLSTLPGIQPRLSTIPGARQLRDLLRHDSPASASPSTDPC